ncbi:MAG: OmpA family protein [Acidobacteria bacterium]|nr:OmpA family protein [Acidobacteriota bacterium]
MKKSAVATLVLVACLLGYSPAHGEQRARSWEVSPFLGGMNTSHTLGNSGDPLAGLRIGYNLNRWWQIELGYSGATGLNVQNEVGFELQGATNSIGVGFLDVVPIDGFVESDGQFLDLNMLLSSRPVKKRLSFYGTIGLGRSAFQGSMTQRQVFEAFPRGPSPTQDTFDFNDNGNTSDLVDEFICETCIVAFIDPADPAIDPACSDPADLSCYALPTDVPARTYITSGNDLDEIRFTQWNVGAGMRVQMTDSMTLRLDLRNLLAGDYTAQILTAGLSFRFGGESPIDDDGDSIPRFRDKCPDTPAGATVDPKGCPADGDGDEILDGLDDCPTTPEGWPVDGKGCPTDGDGDGVPDGRDTCDNTPLGAVVDHEGCPVDSDGDQVPDGLDDCMTTPAGARVDAQGCALDEDGDGVPDGLDTCEGTPAGLPVDGDGCPIDSDGDGLKDDVDACPAFAGPGGVDDEGCPRFRLDKTARISMPGVTFAFGSSVLTDAGMEELGALVAALNYYDDLTFEIEGHTDDVGSERDNFLISMDRARAVRRFLTDAGINPDRMSIRGYGEIRPIADNTTKEGRAENRRIEVFVTGVLETPEEEDGDQLEDAAGDEPDAGMSP